MRIVASAVQQSEMSAGEIVLGLLLERPDTCYQLDKRMAERLGSAQFSRGAAAGAVKRLLERDLVRVRTESQEPAAQAGSVAAATGLRAVDSRRKTVYEPTPAGIEHFQRWLRASTQTPPVREELHAKIALWGSGDVSRLIEIVREAEMSSTLQLQALNRRARLQRRHGDAGEPIHAEKDEWEHTMQLIVFEGEVTWWGARIKWLQDVQRLLEDRRRRQGSAAGAGNGVPPPR